MNDQSGAYQAKKKRGQMNTTSAAVMKLSVEVITLPVSDLERAVRFHVDQVGFTLDVDYAPSDAFRVVQLTPPGSSCSIQIDTGLTDAPAGSLRNVYLVVTDLEAARSRLLERFDLEAASCERSARHCISASASASRQTSSCA